MQVPYQAGAFFHIFSFKLMFYLKRDFLFPWCHNLIMLSEFNHVMTSCVTHSCTLPSVAVTAKSWICLILSLEREHRAYNDARVWNCPSLGLISSDWPLQSQWTPSPDDCGLQNPAGLSKSLTCPFLLCDHEFPPGLEKGGWGWNLAHLFLTLKIMQWVMKQCLTH